MQNGEIVYPFITNFMYIWEILSIGIAAFFLSLQKSKGIIEGSFIKNVLKKAIPAAVSIIVPVGIVYLLLIFQNLGMATGVPFDFDYDAGIYLATSSTANAMAIIIYTIMSLVVLFQVCSPFDKFRKIVFSVISLLVVGCLVGIGIYDYATQSVDLIFKIDFLSLTGTNYFTIGLLILLSASIYLISINFAKQWKEAEKDDQDQ